MTDAEHALLAVGKKIKDAREAKGWKQETLGEKTGEFLGKPGGVTQTTISRIEKGKAAPSDDLLEALADLLDLSLDEMRYLLVPTRIPASYLKFVRIERVGENVASYGERSRKEGFFPIFGVAHAGEMIEAIESDELPEGEQRVTAAWAEAAELCGKSKTAFVVEVDGDSMLPTVRPGDELLVDPKAKLEDNCVALVQVGGKTSIKRWLKKSGAIILTPDNPDRKQYPVKSYTEGQFANENGSAFRVVLARTSRRL